MYEVRRILKNCDDYDGSLTGSAWFVSASLLRALIYQEYLTNYDKPKSVSIFLIFDLSKEDNCRACLVKGYHLIDELNVNIRLYDMLLEYDEFWDEL